MVGILDVPPARFSAVGLLTYWRKSNEWMGLAASLAIFVFGAMPTFLDMACG